MNKEFISAFSIALTFIAFIPYIRAITRGSIKPHAFSWVIWGSTTFVVFLAQLSDNAGAGAWPIGISGLITLYVAVLAWSKKSDNSITRGDWGFFIAGMTSLPLWYLTNDPLWAVVILTTVDLIGFGPTFRKAYAHPYEEQLQFFFIMIARNLLAILALEHYSATTVLFPALTALGCGLLITMVLIRRLAKTPQSRG